MPIGSKSPEHPLSCFQDGHEQLPACSPEEQEIKGRKGRLGRKREGKPDKATMPHSSDIRAVQEIGTDDSLVGVVRPELFHLPEVSGILVPSITIEEGRPAGQWHLYLRWHDGGRREQLNLTPMISFPGGRQLYFDPIPAVPSPHVRMGWSVAARRQWLSGAATPYPVGVFNSLVQFFDRFLEFHEDEAEDVNSTLALWTILTYVYPAWTVVPYLKISGTLGSGKSTVFRCLSAVVFRPLASSNLTAPCLFRSLHDLGGTLLLDEGERLRDRAPEASDMRSILLSGNKRGSPAMRMERVGDKFCRLQFDVYGPKAIASISDLNEALASRCIRITMTRATPDSPKPRRRINEGDLEWVKIRDDLHALALDFGDIWPELAERPDVCPTMSGRDFEVWQPLMALAEWFDGNGAAGIKDRLVQYAMRVIERDRDDATPEADESLLRIVAERVVLGSNHKLEPKGLLSAAIEIDPATFQRWSPKRVGETLKKYGIRSNRSNGRRVYSDVTLAQLRKLERRYAIDLGLPPESVPSAPCALEIIGADTLDPPQRPASLFQRSRMLARSTAPADAIAGETVLN